MAARMAQEPSGTQAAVDSFHRCVLQRALRPQACSRRWHAFTQMRETAVHLPALVSYASERLCRRISAELSHSQEPLKVRMAHDERLLGSVVPGSLSALEIACAGISRGGWHRRVSQHAAGSRCPRRRALRGVVRPSDGAVHPATSVNGPQSTEARQGVQQSAAFDAQ